MTTPTNSTKQKFLSRKQLSERWGMCAESIKRRQAKGELSAYMLGGSVRYLLDDILALEAQSKTSN